MQTPPKSMKIKEKEIVMREEAIMGYIEVTDRPFRVDTKWARMKCARLESQLVGFALYLKPSAIN